MANRRQYQSHRRPYQQGDYYDDGSQSEQFETRGEYQAGEMPQGYADDIDTRDFRDNRSPRNFRDDRNHAPRYYRDYDERERRSQARQQSDYDPLGYYDDPGSDYPRGDRQPGSHSTFTSSSFGGESYSTPMGYSGAGTGTFFDPSSHEVRRNRYRNDHERGFFERAGDEIASWFGDEEAERRREMDHRGRGPANYTRSNERLLEDACERLTHDRGVDARKISVTAQDNEITLDGTVNTRWEKRRAEDCVHDISGVKHVQNNLRIEETEMRAGSSPSGKDLS